MQPQAHSYGDFRDIQTTMHTVTGPTTFLEDSMMLHTWGLTMSTACSLQLIHRYGFNA